MGGSSGRRQHCDVERVPEVLATAAAAVAAAATAAVWYAWKDSPCSQLDIFKKRALILFYILVRFRLSDYVADFLTLILP